MSGLVGSPGWGAGGWGGLGFGGAGALQLLGAVAMRENLVRLQFSSAVYWSGILDPNDASRPALYSFLPTAGTVGMDGSPARAVSPVRAFLPTPLSDPALPSGAQLGQYVDVALDRPLTPYPALYTVAVTGLVTAVRSVPLDSTSAALQFPGLFSLLTVPQLDAPHPRRDFANPQTLTALLDSFPNTQPGSLTVAQLGTFGIDSTGDYAFDEGLTSLKKRIFRRLTTRPGAFAHLGNGYGVGWVQAGKRLAVASVVSELVAQSEAQVALEPEVARVRVQTRNDNTGILYVDILVKTRAGQVAKWTAPFPIK